MTDIPTISIWVTVGQRRHVEHCLPTFLRLNTYPKTRLLIACEEDSPSRPWLEALNAPKEIIVAPKPLADKYLALRAHGGDYFYSIQDDWEYHSDPGPMMVDAVRVLRSKLPAVMVRMTSHTPVFLDLVSPRICVGSTPVGPLALGHGLADMQTVIRPDLFDMFPDLWPSGFDFYANDGKWQSRIRAENLEAAVMLKYWGCCIHVGNVGERGWTTEENRLNDVEGRLLVKYGFFGPRPAQMLYTTALNEEQRREFVYPIYLLGACPLVPNAIPVSAQARLGPARAQEIL